MNCSLRFLLPILYGLSFFTLEARTVRIATFNIEYGPEAPQTPDYAATKAVLGRINADIVAFQEIFNDGRTNRVPDWRKMAAELGYPYEVVAEENDWRAGYLYLGYYSRFPMQTKSVNSPAPASEMSRVPLRAVVQVPGAAKPLVLWNMHHKAGPAASDQFRRAVEAYRIAQDINAYCASNPTHDELVVLGDLNDDFSGAATQLQSFGIADFEAFRSTSLPTTYVLGADLDALLRGPRLPYSVFPDDRYSQAGGGLHRLDLRQQDGTNRVTRGSRTLDYIFVSAALRDSPLGAPRGEVYNSQLDAAFGGLPKAHSPLDSGTSRAASDHLAVFADIQMDDALMFAPAAGAPGATVLITGVLPAEPDSVRFGGVEASSFTADESGTQISAIVPPGAVTGPITVSGPQGESSSATDFFVTALPTIASALPSTSSLTGFNAVAGAVSGAQYFTVSAAGLGGPLQVSAPAGFEVSLDGTNFSDAIPINAPPRSDAATNYTNSWTAGSNEGRGFGPWTFLADNGQNGFASAYLGNPSDSGVVGMGTKAFALRAEPTKSGAFVDVIRPLEQPLAVGEALSFDWGVNWDANDASAEKGFAVKSGFAAIAGVHQAGFPGDIILRYGTNEINTGLAYGTNGTNAMRWTFSQVDAKTLRVTSTARTNRETVAFSTNIPVPGAITGFMWFAFQMDSHTNRRSYYDNLNIAPIAPGGGALSQANVFVRLTTNAPSGAVTGTLSLSSAGQALGSVALSGMVTGGSAYDSWAQLHELDPQGNGARGADADNDGYSNLREFLFGSLPTQPTGSLCRHEMKPAGLVLTFVTRETGVVYKLMSTGNLATGAWEEASTITEAVDQTAVPDGYKRQQVTMPNPSGNRFFRLQAVESSP
jgi:endonuclease/exonuclease/phosphatase family metal-dependent hydrolase